MQVQQYEVMNSSVLRENQNHNGTQNTFTSNQPTVCRITLSSPFFFSSLISSVSTGHKYCICAGTKEKIMISSSCLKEKKLISQFTDFSLYNFYPIYKKQAGHDGRAITQITCFHRTQVFSRATPAIPFMQNDSHIFPTNLTRS